jgi:hypothetical protein
MKYQNHDKLQQVYYIFFDWFFISVNIYFSWNKNNFNLKKIFFIILIFLIYNIISLLNSITINNPIIVDYNKCEMDKKKKLILFIDLLIVLNGFVVCK